MRIANSNVSMASYHEEESFVSVKKASVEWRAESAARAGSAAARYEGFEAWGASVEVGLSRSYAADFGSVVDPYDLRVSLLNRLLEALSGKGRFEPISIDGVKRGNALDLRSSATRSEELRARFFGERGLSASAGGTTSSGTVWRRVTATSYERSEREYTAFRSTGRAVTEDGRSISFGVEFAMSRSFSERFESLSSQTYILTDPLIINLDGNTTSVSDVKYRFDLDADGEEEEISFAGEGSGFLALDRNGNGVIDDGSELFGTQSGDGFADLAAYDEDGNGWIDENDDVYSQLRVWVKDADGSDRLLSLKEANVGAIYLGSVSTEFSLNDSATNETNAVVRRSGVYLRETGEAGTLSHVDLRC